MTEFNPHTIIKRLAEWERPCPQSYVDIHVVFKSQLPYTLDHSPICAGGCRGTGRLAPFAVLRVIGPCPNECDCEPEQHTGRGWVPEPDAEKACWRVLQMLFSQIEAVSMEHEFLNKSRTHLIVLYKGVFADGVRKAVEVVRGEASSWECAVLYTALAYMKNEML